MRRQHRLRTLQMRVAGQDHVAVPLGGRHQGPLQGQQPRVDPVDGVAHPELRVGRHLVVAAPRRVQLPADVPDPVDQGRLDVHVNVLALEHKRETRPASISARISVRPRTICWHSSGVSKPTWASISACAIEPRMSCSKSRRSKEIDSVNCSTRWSVLASNRPPQGLLATDYLRMPNVAVQKIIAQRTSF